MDRIVFSGGVSLRKALLSIVVPGYSFRVVGRRKLASYILLGWGVASLIYVVLLGFTLGGILFGLIVGLHMTGLIHLNMLMNAEGSFRRRIGFGLCGALVLFVCYRAMLGVVENHWLLPLKLKGHVFVVNRLASGKGIQRGDVVAYSMQGSREPGMTFMGGYGLERVVGVAGDVIEFKAASITVNGQSFSRDPMMPVNQVITVPQKCWFIWPDYNIANRGIVPAETVKAGLVRAAIVPEETFVGRPYNYWFGRKQNFP